MIVINDVKIGMTVEYQGNVYTILDFQHVKSANSMAFIRTKLKNLRTGTTTEIAFNNGTKMMKANIEKKKMQYLYDDGTSMAFMDMENFVQIDIPSENLKYEKNYLVEGDSVIILDYNGEVLGIQIPEKVTLEVTETPPGVRGNTASAATKDAIMQTGLHVLVPLFVNVGDKIIVNSNDGKYVSRA